MPVHASGLWDFVCAACQGPVLVDLEKLEWGYKDSFEPSLVVLTYYQTEAVCPSCRTGLPLELEFSSDGGDFRNPTLLVGKQRLRPVQARCDGHEYWSEMDHQMSGEDFAYLTLANWPAWRLDADLRFYEGERELSRLGDQGPGQLYVAGPRRLYVRTTDHWWQSRSLGLDWECLEDCLDAWLTSQMGHWKQLFS